MSMTTAARAGISRGTSAEPELADTVSAKTARREGASPDGEDGRLTVERLAKRNRAKGMRIAGRG